MAKGFIHTVFKGGQWVNEVDVADWGLAASGLLFGLLAVALIALRWMVIRRARSAS